MQETNKITKIMTKYKIRFKHLVYAFAIIIVDLLIFMVLGLLLMNYDDNYDSSKGEYWSLESMNASEKLIYYCYQAWIILNVIGLVYLGLKIFRKIKKQMS